MSSCLKLNNCLNGCLGYMPHDVKYFLEMNGHLLITGIVAKRVPLPSVYENILNVVTLSKWKEEKEKYDLKQLYHTYFILFFENNKKCILEKNEVVILTGALVQDTDLTESQDINIVRPLSLNDLINNTVEKVDDFNFWVYDQNINNCNQFCIDILQSNGILTEDVKQFLYQNVEELFNSLPKYIDKVIDGTTTLASIYRRVSQKIKIKINN